MRTEARGWKTGPTVDLTISERREIDGSALRGTKVPPEKGRDKDATR